ncbi:MAG: DUF4173 domain-containing protein, partial [Thermoactinospora sp.]|nr:DUF4173 domain-containing protein [Thermoactinospora sp.]
ETPRWLLPAAAGAGVFAAVAIPDSAPGLGLVLVALVVAAAALPAVARRVTPWTLAFAAIAVGLISVAAWRDADWLVALCVMGGFGLGALAVSGAGAGWLGVIRGGASVLLSMIPVPWFLAAPLKQLTARRRIMPIVGALGITAFLLLIFGGLFSSADAVFAGYVEQLLTTPEWAESIPGRLFVFLVVGAGLAALVLVALRPVVDPVSPSFRTQVNSALWVVPLSALNVLFALFVALQITVLFGGDERVLRTSGLTYAEYARQGFFQLVFVSVIVVAIVAVTSAVVRTSNRGRWLLAGELGTLCALTMVILFSAWHRMDLYVEAYGWTRLRISVQAAIYGLAILFVLILIAGAVRLAGRGSGWLPRTVVLVAGLGLFAFALVNPDYQVAVSQVDRQRMDASYLRDLGAEAAPALDRAPEPQRSCLLRSVGAIDGPDDWRSWNLARSRARDLIAAKGLVEGPCR